MALALSVCPARNQCEVRSHDFVVFSRWHINSRCFSADFSISTHYRCSSGKSHTRQPLLCVVCDFALQHHSGQHSIQRPNCRLAGRNLSHRSYATDCHPPSQPLWRRSQPCRVEKPVRSQPRSESASMPNGWRSPYEQESRFLWLCNQYSERQISEWQSVSLSGDGYAVWMGELHVSDQPRAEFSCTPNHFWWNIGYRCKR